MIADTFVGLETSRLLTYRAAWLQANGKPCGIESRRRVGAGAPAMCSTFPTPCG